MNSVNIIGNLTKDPEIRYTQSNMAVAQFSVAINRGKDKDGNDRGADFPRVTVFGRQAENCEKYLSKGSKVGVQGHIQTGSYDDKNGNKVYTTDVIADRIEFLSYKDNQQGGNRTSTENEQVEDFQEMFSEDLPF